MVERIKSNSFGVKPDGPQHNCCLPDVPQLLQMPLPGRQMVSFVAVVIPK